jgi:2-phosphosulfolactate phosphatase
MSNASGLVSESVFSQPGYRCRLEWGRRGARVAVERGDILIVVDVLSFSSAVATAIANGAVIFPCAWEDDPDALATRLGAEAAVRRQDVPERGRFSLSPPTFDAARPGERIVLASPNGGTCSRHGRGVPNLFVGTLVNAEAVAGTLAAALEASPNLAVTILACGERWQEPSEQTRFEDGDLRFALEDYLGAGAILAHLPPYLTRSPEARAAEAAFHSLAPDLAAVLADCGSGRELIAKGYGQDVTHAARLNAYAAVPVLRGDALVARDG